MHRPRNETARALFRYLGLETRPRANDVSRRDAGWSARIRWEFRAVGAHAGATGALASRVQYGARQGTTHHMTRKTPPSNARDVVTLADLAPRNRVVGGSERRLFGSEPVITQEDTMASKKDLPAKKTVKAGKKIL